jgi:hypothetical protein
VVTIDGRTGGFDDVVGRGFVLLLAEGSRGTASSPTCSRS